MSHEAMSTSRRKAGSVTVRTLSLNNMGESKVSRSKIFQLVDVEFSIMFNTGDLGYVLHLTFDFFLFVKLIMTWTAVGTRMERLRYLVASIIK